MDTFKTSVLCGISAIIGIQLLSNLFDGIRSIILLYTTVREGGRERSSYLVP